MSPLPRFLYNPPARQAEDLAAGRPAKVHPAAVPAVANGHAAPPGPHPASLGPGGGAAVAPHDLLERRRRLAEELAEIQWDLGGLVYEMAIRDHFRLDVLTRRAARLQEVDAQLGEVERMLRMEHAGAAGECPSCGALHSRGAVFCWQCGHQLLPQTAPLRA
jgi:hypothetical protein